MLQSDKKFRGVYVKNEARAIAVRGITFPQKSLLQLKWYQTVRIAEEV
jgi:hypothetical protein